MLKCGLSDEISVVNSYNANSIGDACPDIESYNLIRVVSKEDCNSW